MYKNINCEVNDALLWNWFNLQYTEMKLIWNKRSHVPWNKFQPTDGIRKQSYKTTRIANTIKDFVFNFENSSYNATVICLLSSTKKSLCMTWYEVTRQDLLERSMKRDAIDVVCNLTALDLFERDVKIVYLKRSH